MRDSDEVETTRLYRWKCKSCGSATDHGEICKVCEDMTGISTESKTCPICNGPLMKGTKTCLLCTTYGTGSVFFPPCQYCGETARSLASWDCGTPFEGLDRGTECIKRCEVIKAAGERAKRADR